MSEPPKKRPAWTIRFSLRTLLLVVVLLSIVLAVGVRLHGRLRQRTAAAMAWSAGGFTWYEVDGVFKCGLPYPNQWDWLFHYEPVVEVDFRPQPITGSSVRDAEVFQYMTKHPSAARNLETRVTDEQLSLLSALPDVRRLDLSHTDITDRGLRYLARLSHLESLDLGATVVSSDELRHVPVGSLRELNLSGTRIDVDGLEWLSRCDALERLTLGETTDWLGSRMRKTIPATPLTDAGLAKLKCPSLKSLNLRGTAVTDSGMAYLTQLPNLAILDLVNTSITDQGLRSLHGLKRLRALHLVERIPVMTYDRALGPPLTKTQITADGVAELQTALPGLRVLYPVNPPRLKPSSR